MPHLFPWNALISKIPLAPSDVAQGCQDQTTSELKMTKILNENLIKVHEIQNLASGTSKMTS